MKPDIVMSDFEEALQAGLQAIFPEAEIKGCWFHFAQVRTQFHFNFIALLHNLILMLIFSECLQAHDASWLIVLKLCKQKCIIFCNIYNYHIRLNATPLLNRAPCSVKSHVFGVLLE